MFISGDRGRIKNQYLISAMRLWLALLILPFLQIVKGSSLSGCDRNPVGIQYRSVIPDSSLTASSYYDSRYVPQYGRLHGSLGWAPSTVYNEQDYLQIDLGGLIEVCGVATQGGRYYNEWVTQYKLQFSKYGAFWKTYQENGTEKMFQGNSDVSTVEIRCLQNLQSARFIRFVPTAYHKHKTMRVEVFSSYLDRPDIVPHERSLQLTWRIMNKVQIVSYLMEFKNKSRIESLILPNDTMEYNLTNLQPYTEYSVRLKGMLRSDGAGVWSNWINAKTAAAAPTCSPVLLSAQATSSTSVLVIWKPPPDNECRNGILKGYRIRCSLSGTENLEIFTVNNVNASTYDITGLQRYTWYKFSVLAYTVANGPWSNQLTNRTAEDAPSCSPDITSIYPLTSVSARVEWSSLPSTHCRRNGIIRGYKIAYKKVDEDELHWSTDSNPNSTAIVVSGLKKFTNYSFQVLAFTVKDGNLSKAAFGRTQEDVPECSPVITNIQAVSSTSVSMAWQQDPTCLNGILRGYIIQYSLLGNSTVQSINITDDRLSTSRNVSGLRKYTTYSFRILAYTIGEGPLSNASVIRTAEDGPSCSPSLLSAQTSSSTSVRLTWKLPPDNECKNGILRGYRIRYWSSPEIGSYNITLVDPLTTTYHVTGLRKYTWYKFTVLAYTVANGPRSNTLGNRTAEDAPECSPTLMSVLNVSSTSINVSWTPLPHGKCRNGVLRGYKIFCNKTSTGERLVMEIRDSDTTTVKVTGLSKYTEYSFRILGYTVKDGPLSNKMTRKTSEDAPDCSPELKSTEVLSSTSIRVRWNRLSRLPCINGIVRGYKIKYQQNGGDDNAFHISCIDTTSADIVGLKKFTWYTFLVLAYTVKDGPLSKEYLSAKTKADAPSAPVNVNRTLLPANGSLGPRIEIRWDEPREKNGAIHKYSLIYFYNKDNATETKDEITPDGEQRTYLRTIDVIGETTFSFKVNAYTINDGPYQNGQDLVVPAYPPSTAPSNISTREINDITFLLQWSPIPRHKSNGHVTKYEVRWIFLSRGRKHRAKHSVVDNTKSDTAHDLQYAITGLLSCAQYSISVRGYTSAGSGPYSTPINVVTSQPDSPFGVLVKQTGATSVLLRWKKPANVVEKIDKYMIEYRGYKTYSKFKTGGNAKTENGTEHRITNLVPATHYEFWVSAFTPCGKSPRSTSAKTETRVTNPLAPKIAEIQQYHETGVSVNVTLFPASQINGPISAYQVIVEFLKENVTRFDHRLHSNYEQNTYSYPIAEKNDVDYYITAEVQGDWLKSSRQLTIGDNLTYSKFRNMPLKKGARYHIYQRTVAKHTTKMLYSKTALVANISVASADVLEKTKVLIRDTTSGSGTIVVGLVVGLMLLIILVTFAAYFILKRQRNVKNKEIKNISLPLLAIKSEQQNSSNDQGLAHEEKEKVIKPIHVNKFAEYISATRMDDFSELLNQFKAVPGTHVFSCIAAKKPVNKVKNRYGNIVAYDHSRVKLQRINGDEDSDYINASFMHGYDGTHKTYIASQGPLSDTINDFWRMIWEQNTTCIIMLTNLIELGKRKCHQYWPENSEEYADITITNHKTEVFADYHIRTLLLTKGTHDKISRRLLLFHFTAWPDKGVPKNATALLSFRRKVREMSKWANTGPTVIHCSAGVGRTGTYMIIDAMLEQVESKKTIDIYNYLNVLRKDRPYMVQTSEQYVFIHMALFEEITCGNTEIVASNLETVMQNLSSIDNEGTLSGYAIEFQRLEYIASYGVKRECEVGQQEENAKKNRYKNIVPVNQCRVILSSDDSNQGDYINATFIDTYRERNAFIMTQAPMQNTIADFWRMVMDYEIGTIVMLNNFQEGDEMFPVYWQQEEPITYDGIEVCLSKTEEYDDILLRTFRVSYESTQRSVQHLQHTAWEENSVPNSSHGLLELFEKVWKSQQKCSNNPVVVHCSNGVGRSGTFCAIASCLERVKQEQVLDVFQTVKNIRVNRPGAVETLSQYEYCYSTLKQYLDSFIDYANFTGI